MPILYHLMIPRPARPQLDAVVQDVESLQVRFGGQILHLNPTRRPGSLYPERLYGMHALPRLRQLEDQVRLHHVFNSRLYQFPYLRWLRLPIVYSVSGSLSPLPEIQDLNRLQKLSTIVVNSQRDQQELLDAGLENVRVVRPGIDLSRFSPAPVPPGPGFTLLAGSAPWTGSQFTSKGVDALLEAAQARQDLRLVFLWRSLLAEEMRQRVSSSGLEERVEVIDRVVDVNQVLARVHAAVVLADDPTLVKGFPHSLLESLAAGRPVLVSQALSMAGDVDEMGCGQVVQQVTAAGVLEALSRLEERYEAFREAAQRVGRRDFSRESMLKAYGRVYAEVGLAGLHNASSGRGGPPVR
jgi:glycosyltransferase involved in cell wall biosynthesis